MAFESKASWFLAAAKAYHVMGNQGQCQASVELKTAGSSTKPFRSSRDKRGSAFVVLVLLLLRHVPTKFRSFFDSGMQTACQALHKNL